MAVGAWTVTAMIGDECLARGFRRQKAQRNLWGLDKPHEFEDILFIDYRICL